MFKKRQKAPSDFSDRQQRIYGFLHSNPIGVLSSVSPDGEPHGSVIYFTIDNDFQVSFVTKQDTRKYDNLKRHDHVLLTVYEPQAQTVAQVTGKAVEIKDSFEINAVAGAILAASLKTSDGGLPPISKLEAGSFVGFRINPDQIRLAVYARPDPGDYSDLFETIECFELRDS